jgi:signal transduction histidine kinase
MEKIVIRFDYTYLRNESHVEFHTIIDGLFVKHTPEALGIKPLYDEYRALLDQETEALDMIRRSGLTADIVAVDHERDRLFRGLADHVKSYLRHFDPARREAARVLEMILEHLGNIARRSLDDKSAALADLHRELQTPGHAVHVATLGLGGWLDSLVEANRRFEGLMRQRYDEMSRRPHVHMRSIRKRLDRVFRDLLDLLEALARVNGPGTNEVFLGRLRVVMERYRDILAQEAGHRRQAKAEGSEII